MKRLFIVLTAELCSACSLHADIITERNDVYSMFPAEAVFRGTSAAPGIESQWIPYGTYTGGYGGTEHLRVTSTLVGVVASAYDGLWERYNISYNGLTNGEHYSVGELWTNSTMRVLDLLDAGMNQVEYRRDGSIRSNATHWAGILEDALSPDDGIMPFGFGSRRLDALCGDVAPPVPTSWTPDFASFLSATNDWANIWPTYEATTNDGVFVTGRSLYSREPVVGFLYELCDYAGSDYRQEVDGLTAALRGISAATALTNVLAYDTGFTSNDFAHFKNMTTRLDWKRLGIICQLERQMEETYRSRKGDELPFYSFAASVRRGYLGALGGVRVRIPSSAVGSSVVCEVTPEPEIDDFQWKLDKITVAVTTNSLGRCSPTVWFDGKAHMSASYEHDITGGGDNIGWDSGHIYGGFSSSIEKALMGRVPTRAGTYSFRLNVQTAASPVSTGLAYTFGDIELRGPIGITFRLGGGGIGSGQPVAGMTIPIDTLYLAAETSKSAAAAYTVSDVAGLVTNLDTSVTHNDTYFWNGGWIASRSLPTLELMISATNDIGDVDASMYWDDVSASPTNGAERVFRLSPESPEDATSATMLRSMRAAAVRSLDQAVKAKFAELAGQGVDGIASSRAQFAPGEEQSLWDALGAQSPGVVMQCSSAPSFEVTGTFESTGDNNARNVKVDGQTSTGDYKFGTWQLSLGSGDYRVTTNTTPARVDGHQSQVLKTLWRWKNLRDPNL